MQKNRMPASQPLSPPRPSWSSPAVSRSRNPGRATGWVLRMPTGCVSICMCKCVLVRVTHFHVQVCGCVQCRYTCVYMRWGVCVHICERCSECVCWGWGSGVPLGVHSRPL